MTLPFLAALGVTSWPEDRAARRALSSALRSMPDPAPWRALVAWAFAQCHDEERKGAPVNAVCELLGVSRETLFRWRSEDAEVGALVTARLKRPPGPIVRAAKVGAEPSRDAEAELAAAALWTPVESPRACIAEACMVTAFDGATGRAEGILAAVCALDAHDLTPPERSAAARAFVASLG